MPSPDPPTLTERFRAAPVGSRELDAEIATAAGWTRPSWGGLAHLPPFNAEECPRWSTSLDAIVALIEARGYVWNVGGSGRKPDIAWVWPQRTHPRENETNHDDIILALCAALAEAEGW